MSAAALASYSGFLFASCQRGQGISVPVILLPSIISGRENGLGLFLFFIIHTLRLINISYLYATLVYETVIKSAYWHIPGKDVECSSS